MINELVNSLRELKNKRQNKPQLVDLGLPSGNLWMTQNMGASCETDYGNYYQFGSLKGYRGFWAKWISKKIGSLDYSNQHMLIIARRAFVKMRSSWLYKNDKLKPKFDIVTQTFGRNYKIPDPKDFEEFFNYTTSEYYFDKGGKLFTSKINGKTLFIPFSGFYYNGSLYNSTLSGSLMSSMLSPSFIVSPYYFQCSINSNSCTYQNKTYFFTIRGIKVRNE